VKMTAGTSLSSVTPLVDSCQEYASVNYMTAIAKLPLKDAFEEELQALDINPDLEQRESLRSMKDSTKPLLTAPVSWVGPI
jgi:hypothetical protein